MGISALFILALIDYKKNPANPTRIKEYAFLFSVAILVMAYGLLHDFITYSISKEYFIFAKGIDSAKSGFSLDVIKLALMATWTAGLIVGVTFLFANNPGSQKKQLKYGLLFKLLSIPLVFSVTFAAIFGIIYSANWQFFAKSGHFDDITLICSSPGNFMAVWGIHTGSYLGALLGLIVAVIIIIKLKH